MSFPPTGHDFARAERHTRHFFRSARDAPAEIVSQATPLNSMALHTAQNNALALQGNDTSYIHRRLAAQGRNQHRMGGLIIRNAEDREAAKEMLANRAVFYAEQERRPPPPAYQTPAVLALEGHIDDVQEALYSEIASGVISASTLAHANTLRAGILANGNALSLQKLVEVLKHVDGSLTDVTAIPPIDSKAKALLESVLESLGRTRSILQKLIALHQQNAPPQAIDQVVRSLRADQAGEARQRLADFRGVTTARMREMEARRALTRGAPSTAPGGGPGGGGGGGGGGGDSDDGEDGDDGGEAFEYDEEEGDDDEDYDEDYDDEDARESYRSNAQSAPAILGSPQGLRFSASSAPELSAAAYSSPAPALAAMLPRSGLPGMRAPSVASAVSALPSIRTVVQPRARQSRRATNWLRQIPLLGSLLAPYDYAPTPQTVAPRLRGVRAGPTTIGRAAVDAPALLPGAASYERRGLAPVAAFTQPVPASLTASQARAIRGLTPAEARRPEPAAEEMGLQYNPSPQDIRLAKRRDWNAFVKRHRGRGQGAELLSQMYRYAMTLDAPER